MEAGVQGEVGLDVSVAVGGALELVVGLVDDARHEASLVVAEILLDGGPEEAVVLGIVAGARASGARKVAGGDLFLEAVEGIGNTSEIVEIGHCVGNGGILRARGGDGAGCGCPVSCRNVASESSMGMLHSSYP